MRTFFRSLCIPFIFAVFACPSFAGESEAAGTPSESFASGTPLWVLGFAAVIAFVFILIPVCALRFKSGDEVKDAD